MPTQVAVINPTNRPAGIDSIAQAVTTPSPAAPIKNKRIVMIDPTAAPTAKLFVLLEDAAPTVIPMIAPSIPPRTDPI